MIKQTHWIILGFAIVSGFMAEAVPHIGSYMLMLAIWLVRAYVIVKSNDIAQRTSKLFAYGVTAIVTLLSLWFVGSLESGGVINEQVATALYIANIFLVVMEVYIGIESAPHPDSVELAETSGRLARLRQTLADKESEIASIMQGDVIVKGEMERLEDSNASLLKEIALLKQARAEDQNESAKAFETLAKIRRVGARHYKINGRHVIVNAPAIADGKPLHTNIYVGNTREQAHSRSGLNGQVKFEQ